MASTCTKCGRSVPNDSVYCPYCGHGIKPSAKSAQVSAGATLLFVGAVADFIFFILSARTLGQIYTWYPPLVAQSWIIYDQALLVISFVGFVFGFAAGALSLARKNYPLTMVSAVACTLMGAGAWILSMIIPFSNLSSSFFYYFLPVFTLPLLGSVLVSLRRVEFDVGVIGGNLAERGS